MYQRFDSRLILAAYRQLETDPVLDAELQRIIRSGLSDPSVSLPLVPPAPEPVVSDDAGARRRPNRRRASAGSG